MLDSIEKPIVVSVIGPANHGKTSVLRTLSEDSKFGDVGDKAGTTTEVHSKSIVYCNMDVMRLCDTPGFQMSRCIGDALNNGARGNLLDDIIKVARRIEEEGEGTAAQAEHDRKAWEQVSRSDVLLLVLDVTQLPDAGFDDDLHLLSRCGKPTVVLLNYNPQSDSQILLWNNRLKGYNFHLVTEYDADHRRTENEEQLFDLLAKVLRDTRHAGIALMLKEARKAQAQERLHFARRRIAQLAVDVMRRELSVTVDPTSKESFMDKARLQLLAEVGRLEEDAWEVLCRTWKFDRTETLDNRDASAGGENAFDSSERVHWFGKKVLGDFGAGAAGGVAAGAALGAAIGFVTAEPSAGAMLGLFVGAFLGLIGGGIFNHRYDGRQTSILVRVTPHLGQIVVGRAAVVARELNHRGRACEVPLRVPRDPPSVASPEIETVLKSVRKNVKPGGADSKTAGAAVTKLEKLLESVIP